MSTRRSPLPADVTRRRGIQAGCLLSLAALVVVGLPVAAHAMQPPQHGQGGGRPQLTPDAKGPAGILLKAQRHQPQRHGGPDDYGYVFDDDLEPGGPVYEWLTGVVRILDSDWQRARVVSTTSPLDDGVVTTTLPFSFNYYGTQYAQMHISTNGNVHFGPPNDWYPDQSGACLPSNSQYVPQAMIAPLWYDLIVPDNTQSGGVYTNVFGTSPNRIYLVEWRHLSKYNPPFGYATFELLLYENGQMVFQYRDLTNPSLYGGEGVVGIQNAEGSIGLPYSCYQASVIPTRAIRYMIGPNGTNTPSRTPTITTTPTVTGTPTATATPWVTTTPCGGPAWRVVSSPNVITGTTNINGLAAVSTGDAWAVGYYTNTDTGDVRRTLVEHWDGESWRTILSPNDGSVENTLHSVAAISADDIWAVGDSYTSTSTTVTSRTLIQHWDGAGWRIVTSPNPGSGGSWLSAVAAIAANDVWAVGGSSDGGAYPTLTMHWNGTRWSVVSSPNPGSKGNSLSAITAIAANDVWAVGSYSTTMPQYYTLTIHWDGTRWTLVPSLAGSQLINLAGVSAVSSNDVWAVGSGDSGTARRVAITIHWDGINWNWVPNPMPGFLNELYGVTAISTNDVWAVGYQWHFTNTLALTMHWNGTDWGVAPNPDTNSTTTRLWAAAAASGYDIWTAGATYTGTPGIHPLIERYTDTFLDVHPSDYFYTAVNYLYCRGVISGYADGTFRPYNNATRGQLAKIVVLASAWSIYTPPSPTFWDVPTTDAFYPYIETAYAHGIISGYTCGAGCLEYRPGNNITRGQLCKIITLARGWILYAPPSPTFSDVPASDPFYRYIETAYAHGIISGYTCGTGCLEFRTGNNATRGQISKIVYLAITLP
jgi:hypothetical protein